MGGRGEARPTVRERVREEWYVLMLLIDVGDSRHLIEFVDLRGKGIERSQRTSRSFPGM